MTKLALGTANFGMDYGINNKKGKLTQTEINHILDYAFMYDINTLDTARAYGTSEKALGTSGKMKNFNVISKFVAGSNPLEDVLDESLRNLKIKKIYGYMYHRFADLKDYPKSYNQLNALKEKGKIEKTGVSVYYPEEVKLLLKHKIPFDIVQIPYNVFDRRFDAVLKQMKDLGMEVHARSAFLQGLVFMAPDELPHNLYSLGVKLRLLKTLAEKSSISVAALCLCFVMQNKYIDQVLVGCDSLNNLTTNYADSKNTGKVRDMLPSLLELKVEHEDLILPSNWKK